MKTKAMKPTAYILLLFFIVLLIFSFFISSFFIHPYSTEAVFLSGEYRISLKRPLYSALPYATVSKPQTTIKSKTEPLPEVVSSPFEIYKSDPAMVSDLLQLKNSTPYTPDTSSLLQKPLAFKKENAKVLIVHTHTSEAYAQSNEYSYVSSDAYRTEDISRNICLVGEKLQKTLEQNAITAIHDTTSHDYPSYSGCYGRSLKTVEKHLAENPSINIVIDLHRDAISDENGNYLKTLTKIDGKDCAQAVIIIGTDAGGLPHSNWEENLSLGLKIQKTMCEMYPSLARPLQLRTERFNGHASHGALLIEIGSNANTMEEALNCAELVGNAIAKTFSAF